MLIALIFPVTREILFFSGHASTKVFEMIKDGANTLNVHTKTLAFIKSKYPELDGHFINTMGWKIGQEFRDKNFLINAKASNTIKEGMTLNISLGFSNLANPDSQDAKSKTYSLLLIDTICVTKDFPIILTDSPKEQGDISYYFKVSFGFNFLIHAKLTIKQDEEELQEEKKEKKPEKKPSNTAILKSKLRGETKNVVMLNSIESVFNHSNLLFQL